MALWRCLVKQIHRPLTELWSPQQRSPLYLLSPAPGCLLTPSVLALRSLCSCTKCCHIKGVHIFSFLGKLKKAKTEHNSWMHFESYEDYMQWPSRIVFNNWFLLILYVVNCVSQLSANSWTRNSTLFKLPSSCNNTWYFIVLYLLPKKCAVLIDCYVLGNISHFSK